MSTVNISLRAEAISTLQQELTRIEQEQLNLAARMSTMVTQQQSLARKSRALNESIKRILEGR